MGRNENSNIQVIKLSSDHKISRQDEFERVIANGGTITEGRSGGLRVIPNPRDYPEAAIIKQKLALNMTRAMGHVVLGKYGVHLCILPVLTYKGQC